MFMQSRIAKSTLLSLALVVGSASALAAQEPLFEWAGRVDGETRIVMRGGEIWTQDVSGRQTRRTAARVISALPSTNGQVRVQVLNGRGAADVIQQPNAQNGYTTIVRVRDPQGSADRYRIAAYWQPAGRGRWGYGRGDVTGRNNRDDQYGYGTGNVDGMMRWAGGVDDEVEVRIQGRNVDTRTLRGNGTSDVRANLNGRPLPRRDVQVSVRKRQGRGDVVVIQQPGQWNDYTAVIRVRDRQGGAAYYDFDVIW